MIKKIKKWFVSFINNGKRVNKELEELEKQDLEEKSKNNDAVKNDVGDTKLTELVAVKKKEEVKEDLHKKSKPVKKTTKKKTVVKKKEKK